MTDIDWAGKLPPIVVMQVTIRDNKAKHFTDADAKEVANLRSALSNKV